MPKCSSQHSLLEPAGRERPAGPRDGAGPTCPRQIWLHCFFLPPPRTGLLCGYTPQAGIKSNIIVSGPFSKEQSNQVCSAAKMTIGYLPGLLWKIKISSHNPIPLSGPHFKNLDIKSNSREKCKNERPTSHLSNSREGFVLRYCNYISKKRSWGKFSQSPAENLAPRPLSRQSASVGKSQGPRAITSTGREQTLLWEALRQHQMWCCCPMGMHGQPGTTGEDTHLGHLLLITLPGWVTAQGDIWDDQWGPE